MSRRLCIEGSDSIQIKVMLDASVLGQPTDLSAQYTPWSNKKGLWKFAWEWDLENKTLDDVVGRIVPDVGRLPEGIGGVRLGNIHAEYVSGSDHTGLCFGIGELSVIYVKGTATATCWGVVYGKPIEIPISGLLEKLIGPRLVLGDLRVGSIEGPFDAPLLGKLRGQLAQAKLLLGTEGPSPTGFVAGLTIMGVPLALPSGVGTAEQKGNAKKENGPSNPASTRDTASPTANAADTVRKWFTVDKTIGPLRVGRVGCEWKDRKLGVLLDSSIEVGGLHLGLTGLRLRVPPFELKPENLELGLEGIDVSYRGGPVSISGALFMNEVTLGGRKTVQYDGMVSISIKAADLAITGMGSYASIDGEPSLFVFAILHKTLGGPVFFRVNGLAAGFGYNRKLMIPPIEEVHTFPLVRASLDKDYLAGSSIQDAMYKLRQYIQPSSGDYWFAVGIRFVCFEMIEAVALLSVSLGNDIEIALLGMARMTIPKGVPADKAIACAELALRAVVRPLEGIIAVEGRLTNASYILSKDCHLTGGFALYLWLAGEHAGDFVVTLGGYHPEFKRPDHYPIVPRLGVNWQVTNELSINSELYFAVTSSCLMTGGKLSVVYLSGPIKAWFIAYANFLVNWSPLYYRADMGISIGVEANIRIPLGFFSISFSIAVHLNVGLQIWGPEFSGLVKVDLSVITITIHFGSTEPSPPRALNADEFIKSFLPSKDNQIDVITAQVSSGLVRDGEQGGSFLGVVNAREFALTIKTLVPITTIEAPNLDALQKSAEPLPQLGVRAMGKRALGSKFSATITSPGRRPTNLRSSLIVATVPDALWAPSMTDGIVPLPDKPEANRLQACVGLRISVGDTHPEGSLPPIAIEKFAFERLDDKPIPWDASLRPEGALSAVDALSKIDKVMDDSTIEARNKVLQVLKAQAWPVTLNQVALRMLSQAGSSYFQAEPKYSRLGEVMT